MGVGCKIFSVMTAGGGETFKVGQLISDWLEESAAGCDWTKKEMSL